MSPNDRDVVQGGSRHFQLLTVLSTLMDFKLQSLPRLWSTKYKSLWVFHRNSTFWAQPLLPFPIFRGSTLFLGGGEMNCSWITNYTSVLFCCCFLFCLKRIMFSVHSLFLLLMKVRIFRSPRCYSLLPWSPPLYWLKRAIRISVQRSSWRWRSFISLLSAESDPVLSICLLLPCHDQNTT